MEKAEKTLHEDKKKHFYFKKIIIFGKFYEFENYTPPFKKIKISHMLSNGLKQSSYIIINNSKGASDRYVKRLIYERINNNIHVDEVWLYEKGKLRILLKKQ